jgi:hypothetical protein
MGDLTHRLRTMTAAIGSASEETMFANVRILTALLTETNSSISPWWRFSALALEELNCALVFFGCRQALEGPEVVPFPVFRILLPRIEAVSTEFQLTDHLHFLEECSDS